MPVPSRNDGEDPRLCFCTFGQNGRRGQSGRLAPMPVFRLASCGLLLRVPGVLHRFLLTGLACGVR